jgi:hypothetical protein
MDHHIPKTRSLVLLPDRVSLCYRQNKRRWCFRTRKRKISFVFTTLENILVTGCPPILMGHLMHPKWQGTQQLRHVLSYNTLSKVNYHVIYKMCDVQIKSQDIFDIIWIILLFLSVQKSFFQHHKENFFDFLKKTHEMSEVTLLIFDFLTTKASNSWGHTVHLRIKEKDWASTEKNTFGGNWLI